ncbi:TPA: hypothetical protein ACJSQD_001834 [Streptococcus agalactiae]|uniref:hypothetical protein n=1 Tax=Streptococcus TaxID=1301 RepID=UPI0002B9E73F|nr:hypothetical protein [Streptococcus agalactiae]EPT58847.1 hypothetical protein SAG0060_02240 [Streptococcus agalactiae CCUG 37737]HEO0316858.1 hypothetical protein [Streptococcus agalactiae]HEO3672724.1 hypothetical protein [Streptococcus agalactiae]HEP5428760.1 hypothetical protein [Streptococcus pyogenes]
MDIDVFIKLFDWFFDYTIIFVNSGTLTLANILAKKNHYQPLIETRHQQILNEILFPFLKWVYYYFRKRIRGITRPD